MRRNDSWSRCRAAIAIPLLLSVLLASCGGKPQQKESTHIPAPPPQQQLPAPTVSNPSTLPASNYSGAFASAEQSLAKFDWMQADVALRTVPSANLNLNDSVYLAYLQARISYIRGNQMLALQQLEQLKNAGMSPALRYRINSFQYHILDTQGDTLASAQLADQILRIAPSDSLPAWKRSIWHSLERTDTAQLSSALTAANDAQWRGWLELALIDRDNSATLADRLTAWRDAHPQHPAAKPLPGGLDYLLSNGPHSGKVALMLPLSGKLAPAGRAVLNGFLAAYYEGRASGFAANELLVMDIDTYPTAGAAYQEAVRQQASLVVGPLSKEGVAELATQVERPVPVLALNRIDQSLPASGSALVQLSLSPEDEAAGIAELAFGNGARRALVMSPSGDWGNKMESALRERWSALGGTITAGTRYNTYEDYASNIQSMLALGASEQRGRELSTVLGTAIEFSPRRRQDIDVVFLLCRNGTEARSIKPLLAYYYAGNIPVYAPSSVYNGVPDERNQDLDGIHVVETPWMLGANPGLRVTLAAVDTSDGDYTRLNALGADAYLLQSGFGRLQSGADALFRGNTGLLSMNPNLGIQRELSPAIFDGSVLKAQ
jgi:outer membrane PBP1 activator LpoA protein